MYNYNPQDTALFNFYDITCCKWVIGKLITAFLAKNATTC